MSIQVSPSTTLCTSGGNAVLVGRLVGFLVGSGVKVGTDVADGVIVDVGSTNGLFPEDTNKSAKPPKTIKVTAATDHSVPHYFQMDKTGSSKTSPRKGGTIFRGPGAFQVRHGDGVEKEIPGVYIDSGNGDMILISQGRIRLIAEDIDLIATGGGGEHGVITVNANEKILANSKGSMNVKTNAEFQLHTNKKGRVNGKGGIELNGVINGHDLMSSEEDAITETRSNGFLNTGGYRVSPTEIEETILKIKNVNLMKFVIVKRLQIISI